MFRFAERASVPATTALYVPGDRPDRILKAIASGSDAVVIDLEDAVAPDAKAGARAAVAALLDEIGTEVACQVHVRCNRTDEGWDDADLAVAVHPAITTLRLAKAEHADHVRAASTRISQLEAERGIPDGSIALDLLIESAAGVLHAADLAGADARVRHLCLGGADLASDLGANATLGDADPLLLARQMLVLASRAHGRPGPVDTVCTDIADDARIEREALAARALGYSGKSIIHPRQIAAVRRAFAPTEAELAWADGVRRAWDAARAEGSSATVVDGEFVDAPVAARALQILSLATDRQGAP